MRGQHRPEPVPDFGYPPVDDRLMTFLMQMYQAHEVEAFRVNNWVVVGGGKLMTRAACMDMRHHPGSLMMQVDFITIGPGGEHIIESFAGIGRDEKSSLQDACKGFQDGSFPRCCATIAAIATWSPG